MKRLCRFLILFMGVLMTFCLISCNSLQKNFSTPSDIDTEYHLETTEEVVVSQDNKEANELEKNDPKKTEITVGQALDLINSYDFNYLNFTSIGLKAHAIYNLENNFTGEDTIIAEYLDMEGYYFYYEHYDGTIEFFGVTRHNNEYLKFNGEFQKSDKTINVTQEKIDCYDDKKLIEDFIGLNDGYWFYDLNKDGKEEFSTTILSDTNYSRNTSCSYDPEQQALAIDYIPTNTETSLKSLSLEYSAGKLSNVSENKTYATSNITYYYNHTNAGFSFLKDIPYIIVIP